MSASAGARAERAARLARKAAELEEVDAEVARQRQRRSAGSLTFRSVADLLEWWGAAVVRMQGAQGMHPRTEAAPTAAGNGLGERCVVRVDGGPGSSLDDVHATLASVRRALERLGREVERRAARRGRPPVVDPARYAELLVEHHVHGVTVEALAKRMNVAQGTMSAHLGKAERALVTLLYGSVIT